MSIEDKKYVYPPEGYSSHFPREELDKKRSREEVEPCEQRAQGKTISTVAAAAIPMISEPILEQLSEQVKILREDEYFKKFITVFQISIPPLHGIATQNPIQIMKVWVHALEFSMESYLIARLAKSLGTETIESRAKSGSPSSPYVFVDHTSLQEALNAKFALDLFRQAISKIELSIDPVHAATSQTSAETDAEDLTVALQVLSLSPATEEKTTSEPPAKRKQASAKTDTEELTAALQVLSLSPATDEKTTSEPPPKRKQLQPSSSGDGTPEHVEEVLPEASTSEDTGPKRARPPESEYGLKAASGGEEETFTFFGSPKIPLHPQPGVGKRKLTHRRFTTVLEQARSRPDSKKIKVC